MSNKNLPTHKLQAQSKAVTQTLRHILYQVFIEGAPADRTLSRHLRSHKEYGSRDRRLITESVFAVFRWWGWLRFVIDEKHREIPPPGMVSGKQNAGQESPLVRLNDNDEPEFNISDADMARLLLGAHMLELKKDFPQPAAVWISTAGVDENAVQMITDKISETAQADSYSTFQLELIKELYSVFYPESNDMPIFRWENLQTAWIVEKISNHVEPVNLIQWLQKRPPLWLRVQFADVGDVVRELKENDVQAVPHDNITNACRLSPTRTNLYALPLYRKGKIEIQDIASQCTGIICNAAPKERWWDACAGAGGKTIQLAAMMASKGTVVASDNREYKLKDLKKRARRAGIPNINTQPWNGGKPDKKRSPFDGVLVDAPCSGSGVWRRNPEGRWIIKQQDLEELTALQYRLLSNASQAVKTGGALVYATCSVMQEENSDIIDKFLAEHPQFILDTFSNPLTGENINGKLQIWPWDADCDAMFIARMVRQ